MLKNEVSTFLYFFPAQNGSYFENTKKESRKLNQAYVKEINNKNYANSVSITSSI